MSESIRLAAHRACRLLLRPIAKLMLRCGMTYREFAEVAKTAFVAAAGEEFGVRGRETNASRVAIITGLHRREIRRQRELLKSGDDASAMRVNNASRVLSGWYQDPDFYGVDGEPVELATEGEEASFEALCRKYGGDIPWTALLKELRHVGAVEETNDGRLRVLSRYYMPSRTEPAAVERTASVLHDISVTGHYNLFHAGDGPTRFEGRATNTRIARRALKEFRGYLENRGERFLEEIDDWLTRHEAPADAEPGTIVRVGAGVYHIQEDDAPA